VLHAYIVCLWPVWDSQEVLQGSDAGSISHERQQAFPVQGMQVISLLQEGRSRQGCPRLPRLLSSSSVLSPGVAGGSLHPVYSCFLIALSLFWYFFSLSLLVSASSDYI